MDKDTLDDLKQFITATVSQQTDRLEKRLDKMDSRLDNMDDRFDKIDDRFDKIDDRFDENDEKLNEILDVLGHNQVQVDDTLAGHERRIVKLERKAA
jgi:archaellum component FlaC